MHRKFTEIGEIVFWVSKYAELLAASGRFLGIGVGWPGAIRGGLNVVYSSALDVKSFRVCFRYWIVLAEFIPSLPLPLGMVSIR